MKIKSPDELHDLWNEYKDYCDNQPVLTHDFSSKNSEFVSKELKRSITYTIEGFCVWLGIARQSFYDTYTKKKQFSDMVTRMREECEIDARRKFETGVISERLAGLWMSRHGYSTKIEDTTQDKSNGVLPAILEYLKNEKPTEPETD